MNRPHFQKGVTELRRLFASHRDDVGMLRQLLEELAHRKTPSARSLMVEVRANIEDVVPKPQDREKAFEQEVDCSDARHTPEFEGEDEERPVSLGGQATNEATKAVKDRPRTGTGDASQTRSPPTGELFGSETEAYGPIPDDRERPDRLTLIRPPGTTGLPDAYVRPLKREVALNLAADADLPDHFIAAVQELIQEIKKTGAGRRRYELEKGYRADAAGGEILYKFPFTDEAMMYLAPQRLYLAALRAGPEYCKLGA